MLANMLIARRAAWKRLFTLTLILLMCLCATQSANANVGYASDGKAAGVIIAIVGVGVLIGVGVYFAVHHGHTLRGCTSGSPQAALQLLNEGDGQSYRLSGDVAGIKAGERIRVSGKKAKHGGAAPQFLVSKVSKDYGACPLHP